MLTEKPAGDFRHTVTVQDQQRVLVDGEYELQWVDVAKDVAASVVPLSGKDFIAAQATQSQMTTRIVIRWRPGITSRMRVLHGAEVYSIVGPPLPDDTGRRWLTLMCATGVGDGS